MTEAGKLTDLQKFRKSRGALTGTRKENLLAMIDHLRSLVLEDQCNAVAIFAMNEGNYMTGSVGMMEADLIGTVGALEAYKHELMQNIEMPVY